MVSLYCLFSIACIIHKQAILSQWCKRTLKSGHSSYIWAKSLKTATVLQPDYLNPGLQDIQLIDPGLAQSTFLK